MSSRASRDGAAAEREPLVAPHERTPFGEPSTSGRLFQPGTDPGRGDKASRLGSDLRRGSSSHSLFSSAQAHLPRLDVGGRAESRPLGSSGAHPQPPDRNAPLDLRRTGEEEDSPLTLLQRRAAGRELSQGLTSLLNAPGQAGSAASQLTSLGAVWCWPFGGAGPELSLAVPPPDPTILPPVSLADFQPYLRSCGAAQRRFAASRTAARPAASPQQQQSPGLGGLQGGRVAPGEGLLEALRAVPQMFFEEGFSLARPETWREVVATEDEAQRLARLEAYGGFLDVVESQLLREIASRSDHFFEAAGVVQDLRLALHRTYGQVTGLRQGVGQLKSGAAAAAEAAQRRRLRRANMLAVTDVLKVVQEVAAAQQAVELLLPAGDYVGALDVLDSLRGLLAAHRVLAGLAAFRRLPAQLQDISEAVDELLSSELLAACRWASAPAAVEQAAAGLIQPLAGAEARPGAAGAAAGGRLAELLLPLVLGLRRTGRLEAAVRALQISAAEDAKAGIRDLVELSLQQLLPASPANTSTSDRLQELSPEQFVALLRAVAAVSLACVRHTHACRAAVAEALAASAPGGGAAAGGQPGFAAVVQAVGEAAHGRWIKLLAARSGATTALELGQLQQLLAASAAFAEAMQGAGCRPVAALRNVTQAQSKSWLEGLHHSALAHLAAALEREAWAAAPVPRALQRLADQVVEGAALAGGQPGPLPTQEAVANAEGSDAEAGAAETLAVAGGRFRVCGALLALLQLLARELRLLDVARALAAEVTHRCVELVKVFNSRMCQLVLGAGAMQAAGLKSITAKHLALSCQCLGALLALQPPLAALLTSHLPPGRRGLVAPELELVLKDLGLHRSEVHSKLVGIMRERLLAALRALPQGAGRWASLPPEGAFPPSSFAQGLAKQLRVLAQVLGPMLQAEELQSIFGRVAALYSKNLAEAFSRLEPLGPSWERQARADISHLLAALAALPAGPGKEASLGGLRQLLHSRFPEPGGGRRGQLAATAAEEGGAGQGARPTLVSRLSNARLPAIFKRERPEPGSPQQQQQRQQPARAASNGSATPRALLPPDAAAAQQLAPASSAAAVAAEADVPPPLGPDSRVASFGDELTAFSAEAELAQGAPEPRALAAAADGLTAHLPAEAAAAPAEAAAAAGLPEAGAELPEAAAQPGSDGSVAAGQGSRSQDGGEAAAPASAGQAAEAAGSGGSPGSPGAAAGSHSASASSAGGASPPAEEAAEVAPASAPHKAADAIQAMLASMQAEDWANGSDKTH